MTPFKDFLRETSLSRVHSHISAHETGFITAYRDVNSKAENKKNNRELLAWLLRKGYGVTKVKGSYIMDHGTENAREVGEPSFFVVDLEDTGKLHADLVKASATYGQESVLLVPKGGKDAFLQGTSKDSGFLGFGEKMKTGSGKYGKVAGEFLSRVKGREMAFESFKSRNDRWVASILAEGLENRIED